VRVFVQKPHVGMSRRRVEIKIVLLHVFAVIPFVARESEKTLFEDRIFTVPEGEGKTDVLMSIRDPGYAVLAPTISAAPRMLMGQIVPGVSICAVVLAHGAPLALG